MFIEVPFGNLSVRAVNHNCSIPLGQSNLCLSFRWGMIKRYTKAYTNYQLFVGLLSFFIFFFSLMDQSWKGVVVAATNHYRQKNQETNANYE